MRPLIIAEVASNHLGDLELAKEYIRVCAANSINYVKFQSWQAKNIPQGHEKKDYFAKREMPDEWHQCLIDYCREHRVEFLTSVFDPDRIEFLASLGMKAIKVPSTYAARDDVIDKLLKYPWKLIVSTGMSDPEKIVVLAGKLREDDVLMHCVSLYPTPRMETNLARIFWLKHVAPGKLVGYSDHSVGISALEASHMFRMKGQVAIVEKHVNIGECNPHEVHPTELAKLVDFYTGVRKSRLSTNEVEQYWGIDILSVNDKDVIASRRFMREGEMETFRAYDHLLG